MPSTWTDPQLGPFEFKDAWVTTVAAPAFRPFKYHSGYRESVPNGKVQVWFDADGRDDVPSKSFAALATKVLANLEKLVPKITASVSDDLCGRGPDSGMWWHGDPEQLAEMMGGGDHAPPQREKDLLRLMRPYQIILHKKLYDYPKPVAEIVFRAAFDEEHGVGVLTDGTRILGIGYGGDADPFS